MSIDWPGLLKWSLKYHDGTKPTEFKPLSDEDKAFLERAFEEACGMIEDMNKIMGQAIEQLKNPEKTNESIITALEIMDRCCDDPDCSRNIEKLDGLQTLIDIVREWENEVIKVRALEVLALMLSNNPDIQAATNRRGGMELFVKITRESDPGSDVRSKAFRSCAALVRGVEDLQKKFVKDLDGTSVAVTCLAESEEASLRGKAASLLRDLTSAGCLDAEAIAQVVPALSSLIGNPQGDMQYRELLAGCAHALIMESSSGSDLKPLKEAVAQRLTQLKEANMEDFNEEKAILVQCG